MADTVEKVENRTTSKISESLILERLHDCAACSVDTKLRRTFALALAALLLPLHRAYIIPKYAGP
jgi:hypothetical protein